MGKEFHIPSINLPDRLPLEGKVDEALDVLRERVSTSPALRGLQRLHSHFPKVVEADLGTPLGRVKLPEISVPKPELPEMDERKKEAVKASVAMDLAYVVGAIPVIGDAINDVVHDIYFSKVRKTLNPQEFDLFMKYNKLGPNTYAVFRALTGGR